MYRSTNGQAYDPYGFRELASYTIHNLFTTYFFDIVNVGLPIEIDQLSGGQGLGVTSMNVNITNSPNVVFKNNADILKNQYYYIDDASGPVRFINTGVDSSRIITGKYIIDNNGSISTNAPYYFTGTAFTVTGQFYTSGSSTVPLGAVYDINGNQLTAPHQVMFSGALSSGCLNITLSGNAVYSSSTSYNCNANYISYLSGMGTLAFTYNSGTAFAVCSYTSNGNLNTADINTINGTCEGY